MKKIDRLLVEMSRNPAGVRFTDLAQVCQFHFGDPWQGGSSHRIYRTPWPGDPRVNIQDFRGMAKPYQVKQVLAAIERLKGESG